MQKLSHLPSDPPGQKEMGYERFLHGHAYRDPEEYTHTHPRRFVLNSLWLG